MRSLQDASEKVGHLVSVCVCVCVSLGVVFKRKERVLVLVRASGGVNRAAHKEELIDLRIHTRAHKSVSIQNDPAAH